ncbi:hypothetical protein ACHAAC_06245 [Aeromicrobium sp. CF4.19]|uniref:hypothetical protein n=1 Tax=Aeromicrobium sp. CF4.19 TaxID=3373082 RepID=UPI003EE80594
MRGIARSLAVLTVAVATLLAGCSGPEAPDRVRASLLQPSDLPGEAPTYFYPTDPGGGGLRVEGAWGCYGVAQTLIDDTGYVKDWVAYDLGDRGWVYGYRYTNEVRDVADDLDDMTEQWRACDQLGYNTPGVASSGEEETVTEVDHGAGSFGFRTSAAGEVYGETAYAVVDDAIVQVTAIGYRGERPTDLDVTSLLASALERAS